MHDHYKNNSMRSITQKIKARMGPDGLLLFDRQTGINLLIDELSIPQQRWSAAPRYVSIALTNTCDLKCCHCYAPKHPARLSYEHLTAWLDELDANDCIGVGFGGGEPTLYKNFIDVCKYITKNTQMAVTFTTHGHHIDDRLASDLKGNIHFIRVSMDGVGNTYERLRNKRFSSLLHRLELIRQVAPFGINYLVNKLTLPDLNAGITLAARYGASEFLLLPEQPVRGHGGVDKQTMIELRKWVKSFPKPIPLRISEAGSEHFPICDPLLHEKGLRAYAHIDASGILKYSSFDESGVILSPKGVMHALTILEKTRGKCK
ncbi:radical SAM protein [Paenibacillus dendritiformis]|uniref:radical SAM protein n=1 Tax=Paenibacillus dendritiformis TaxID=130049 RepID=UPI00248AB893|nr:radical SAM protein [Paenibacillus dendritiformis]WGU96465.1 radical SAM protein [Paenibacillus dendritiformis]